MPDMEVGYVSSKAGERHVRPSEVKIWEVLYKGVRYVCVGFPTVDDEVRICFNPDGLEAFKIAIDDFYKHATFVKGWCYPCLRCRHFPCGDMLQPYCLILYHDNDVQFRSVVKGFGLTKAEAAWVIMQMRGNGVCLRYEPEGRPKKTEKAAKALEFLKKVWD